MHASGSRSQGMGQGREGLCGARQRRRNKGEAAAGGMVFGGHGNIEMMYSARDVATCQPWQGRTQGTKPLLEPHVLQLPVCCSGLDFRALSADCRREGALSWSAEAHCTHQSLLLRGLSEPTIAQWHILAYPNIHVSTCAPTPPPGVSAAGDSGNLPRWTLGLPHSSLYCMYSVVLDGILRTACGSEHKISVTSGQATLDEARCPLQAKRNLVCSQRVSFCVTAPSSGLCRAGAARQPDSIDQFVFVGATLFFFSFGGAHAHSPCLVLRFRIRPCSHPVLGCAQAITICLHQQPRLQRDNSHHVTTSPSAPLSLASFPVLHLNFIWGCFHDPVHLQIPSFVEKALVRLFCSFITWLGSRVAADA